MSMQHNSFKYQSNDELEDELIQNFKNRALNQRFSYLWWWSNKFYEQGLEGNPYRSKGAFITKDYIDFWNKYIFNKNQKESKWSILISLWCWDASKDFEISSVLKNNQINHSYIWIDSSSEMISLAKKTFSKSKIENDFICTDFWSIDFIDRIKLNFDLNGTKSFSKVFMLFGMTLWNFNQTSIVDTLYNTLNSGDIVWLDCMIYKDRDNKNKINIFNDYLEALNDVWRQNFYSNLLKKVWISFDYWNLILKTQDEKSIWVLRCDYWFKFKKPLTISYKDHTFHFLPPEIVNIYSVRIYHPESVIEFFEKHWFELVASTISGWWIEGQFAFRKVVI